jgi:hypothetical protein
MKELSDFAHALFRHISDNSGRETLDTALTVYTNVLNEQLAEADARDMYYDIHIDQPRRQREQLYAEYVAERSGLWQAYGKASTLTEKRRIVKELASMTPPVLSTEDVYTKNITVI